MAGTFQKPLTIGKSDNYTFTVNARWLAGETITDHNVIVDGKVAKNNSGVIGNVIGVSLTGVESGPSLITFEFTTSGSVRTDCATATVIVTSNCQ